MIKKRDVRSILIKYLKELHLPTVRECFEEVALKAQQETLSYEQYLLDLVERESEVRQQNRIERMLRQSKMPLEKTLEAFDLKRLPQKVRRQVATLIEDNFLDRKENVLAFGNPGSGKTHLLCAIGQELIRQGRRIYFTPCNLLVQELMIGKRDLKLPKMLKRLSKFDALILD